MNELTDANFLGSKIKSHMLLKKFPTDEVVLLFERCNRSF